MQLSPTSHEPRIASPLSVHAPLTRTSGPTADLFATVSTLLEGWAGEVGHQKLGISKENLRHRRRLNTLPRFSEIVSIGQRIGHIPKGNGAKLWESSELQHAYACWRTTASQRGLHEHTMLLHGIIAVAGYEFSLQGLREGPKLPYRLAEDLASGRFVPLKLIKPMLKRLHAEGRAAAAAVQNLYKVWPTREGRTFTTVVREVAEERGIKLAELCAVLCDSPRAARATRLQERLMTSLSSSVGSAGEILAIVSDSPKMHRELQMMRVAEICGAYRARGISILPLQAQREFWGIARDELPGIDAEKLERFERGKPTELTEQAVEGAIATIAREKTARVLARWLARQQFTTISADIDRIASNFSGSYRALSAQVGYSQIRLYEIASGARLPTLERYRQILNAGARNSTPLRELTWNFQVALQHSDENPLMRCLLSIINRTHDSVEAFFRERTDSLQKWKRRFQNLRAGAEFPESYLKEFQGLLGVVGSSPESTYLRHIRRFNSAPSIVANAIVESYVQHEKDEGNSLIVAMQNFFGIRFDTITDYLRPVGLPTDPESLLARKFALHAEGESIAHGLPGHQYLAIMSTAFPGATSDDCITAVRALQQRYYQKF